MVEDTLPAQNWRYERHSAGCTNDNQEDIMYAPHRFPMQPGGHAEMLFRSHEETQERDIQGMRLVKLAHAARPRRRSFLPALSEWVRSHLSPRSHDLPAGTGQPRHGGQVATEPGSSKQCTVDG